MPGIAPTDLSAVILAGGQSRRMGSDKAWLRVRGQPLIVRAVNTVRELGINAVYISGRPDVDYSAVSCPVLLDRMPGIGPLGGIERALAEISTPLLVVLAVDLPWMRSTLLEELILRCDHVSGIVPTVGGVLEPLAAIYPKGSLALAAECIESRRFSARGFAEKCLSDGMVRPYPVAMDDARCFTNWNSLDDISTDPNHDDAA